MKPKWVKPVIINWNRGPVMMDVNTKGVVIKRVTIADDGDDDLIEGVNIQRATLDNREL